ncbi:MAG: helix-turn-helix transcriptional regulator [Oligoflexia bacterium]|nr:helix-turn-helix transcriptional regulator [Oligoflexia bacterium]
MTIQIPPYRLILGVKGGSSSLARREILKLAYAQLTQQFPNVAHAWVEHLHHSGLTRVRDWMRGMTSRQIPIRGTPQQNLGYKIRLERLRKGLTQTELSKRIGIARNHLSDLEHGYHFPNLLTLEKLGKEFGVDLLKGLERKPDEAAV